MSREKEVGFVGIGRMGGPMARRLIDAGYSLTVFDTNADAVRALGNRNVTVVASPKEVADRVATVLLSLPTPDIVLKVAAGQDGLTTGTKVKTVIDLSTTGPKGSKALAAALAEKGIGTVDAPVSGGISGAEKGTLALMVAGSDADVATATPILENFGKIFLAGAEPGMGQTIKVINNLMSVTAIAITSEALVLGKASGVDPDLMLKIINASSGRSNASEDKFPRFVLPRTFDFGFALELSDKDTRLCLEHADALGMPMVVGSAVRQALKIAMSTEGRNADLTTIIKPIEKWMGIEVKGDTAK